MIFNESDLFKIINTKQIEKTEATNVQRFKQKDVELTL